MSRITKDYADHTKDELLAEVKHRGIEGVTTASAKADIVTALETSDAAGDEDVAPVVEAAPKAAPVAVKLKPPHPNLPKVALIEPESRDVSVSPKDEDFTDGVFVKSDGEKYALAIHEPDAYGRTHSLKNTAHFWQGNEKEFKLEFTKK